ncbi:MAG: putative glycoside hydrolase [bacterium]|nr:putative glycoside hydrolase [bacterium]
MLHVTGKKALFLVGCLLFLVVPFQAGAVEIKSTYPRLANYFLHWTISDQEASELAKWNFLILDPEVSSRSPEALKKIRQLNPDIIILAYIAAGEIRSDWSSLKNIAPLRYKLGNQISDGWYLKSPLGFKRSFWPGMWILNVTDKAPLDGGRRWNDFISQFVVDEFLKNDLWDGVFLDNGWENITYFAGGAVDLDDDKVNENNKETDKFWQDGLKKIYRKVSELNRALNLNKIILENDGPLYASEVDGVMLENFPQNKDWTQFAGYLTKIRDQSRKNLSILNANTNNSGKRDNWAVMRYGFATAALFDGFYSFDYGDKDHGQTWWYDEYDTFLGKPLGQARRLDGSRVLRPDLWRRDFENGVIFVNSADKIKNLRFDEEFERLIGSQDKTVNSGGIVSEFSLSPQDAVVLRRPLSEVSGAAYVNGAFNRVFDIQGKATRNGFFSYNAKYSTGTKLAQTDLDGDKKDETIVVSGNALRVVSQNQTTIIVPFGKDFKGGLNFAFGDVNGDGRKEIVVAGEQSGGGEVRVYRDSGELLVLPWRTFGNKYKGGVNLAVGDLENDGQAEVIVGAGQGGGPQVRIFSYQGRLLSGGFFAYDPRWRGGVRLAAGDLNGDGKAEIVTAPGQGDLPQIKVFNSRGQTISTGFLAFDARNKSGLWPAVADLDKDGKMEIVVAIRN